MKRPLKFLTIYFMFVFVNNSLFAKMKLAYLELGGSIGSSSYIRNSTYTNNQGINISYSPGLFCGLRIKKNLFLDVGLCIERKGSYLTVPLSSQVDSISDKIIITENFTYLTLPILLHFRFLKNKGGNLRFGPSFEQLIENKETIDIPKISRITNFNKEYYKLNSLGFIASIGYKIKVYSRTSVNFEFRNNVGLTNILKKENSTNKISILSSSLYCSLSYHF